MLRAGKRCLRRLRYWPRIGSGKVSKMSRLVISLGLVSGPDHATDRPQTILILLCAVSSSYRPSHLPQLNWAGADSPYPWLLGAYNAYRRLAGALAVRWPDGRLRVLCCNPGKPHFLQEPLRRRDHCRRTVRLVLRGLELLSPRLRIASHQWHQGRRRWLVDLSAYPAIG